MNTTLQPQSATPIGSNSMSTNQPAIPLDDLPRPGVAISRERWLELVAAEAENAKLREERDKARRTCAELVTDGNAVTLAESLQRKCAELAEAKVQLKDMTDQFFAVSQETAALRTHGLWREKQ